MKTVHFKSDWEIRWQIFKSNVTVGRLRLRNIFVRLWPFHILGICRLVGLDKWFAVRILGWEFDFFISPDDPNDYHFLAKDRMLVRPRDYSFTRINETKTTSWYW